MHLNCLVEVDQGEESQISDCEKVEMIHFGVGMGVQSALPVQVVKRVSKSKKYFIRFCCLALN